MSDDWDFWFCELEEKSLFVFVDLGIHSEAPIETYAHLAFVRLQMHQPRSDGLPSKEEYPTLVQIEESLRAQVCADSLSLFIGIGSSQGRRIFYFYTREPARFSSLIALAMKNFPDYRFRSEIKDDPFWQIYRSFLYPPPEELERIGNRRVCDRLKENGDDLTTPRAIDHCAYFSDTIAMSEFVQYLRREGFKILSESLISNGKLRVEFSRSDVPQQIDDVTLTLFREVSAMSGEYDGWGCVTCPKDVLEEQSGSQVNPPAG
jgi:uncharacterized protein (TIGR01619 family)